MVSSCPFYLLDSGPGEPACNMALDEALLEAMPRLDQPVLRFYGWTEPAATFGYFQHYAEIERLTRLRPLVRRPTGGGLVPHDADWTYSLAFPTSNEWFELLATESYRRVHQWIQAAFGQLQIVTHLAPQAAKTAAHQCFVGYEQSDLLWRGKKIAGAAQRRRRDGLLIQGSIQPPPGPSRETWQQMMLEAVIATAPIRWQTLKPDPQLRGRTLELVERKYSQASYNQRR